MPNDSYEIRICEICGLRYPLIGAHAEQFGIRCPACLGETRVVLSRSLTTEPETPACPEPSPKGRARLAVLLDNIRSAWNVGSIFRSADGFGFAHIHLCGITPVPNGPSREAVEKTSLGAENSVPWSYHKDAVRLVRGLRREGWRILALEEDERAIPITSASTASRQVSVHPPGYAANRHDSPHREVLILGNEVTGVDPKLLDLCDSIYCIPMRGQKRSLNVAIAFGIAAYALSQQGITSNLAPSTKEDDRSSTPR